MVLFELKESGNCFRNKPAINMYLTVPKGVHKNLHIDLNDGSSLESSQSATRV